MRVRFVLSGKVDDSFNMIEGYISCSFKAIFTQSIDEQAVEQQKEKNKTESRSGISFFKDRTRLVLSHSIWLVSISVSCWTQRWTVDAATFVGSRRGKYSGNGKIHMGSDRNHFKLRLTLNFRRSKNGNKNSDFFIYVTNLIYFMLENAIT